MSSSLICLKFFLEHTYVARGAVASLVADVSPSGLPSDRGPIKGCNITYSYMIHCNIL